MSKLMSKITIDRSPQSPVVRVRAGELSFQIHRKAGSLFSLALGSKVLIADDNAPQLVATLMHSAAWDGLSDHVADAMFEHARFEGISFDLSHDDNHFTATIVGGIRFAAGRSIAATISYAGQVGQPHLSANVTIKTSGRFDGCFLRSLSWRLPLALNVRKRITQGGDDDRTWDSRYLYQFHKRPLGGLLADPDHNQWRHFVIEQDAANHFSIWRAESDHTAGLIAQHGERAPGWIGAYDQQGGLLVAYRDMSANAPKTLRVNGEGGGAVEVQLHPPTRPALNLQSPGAARLFGATHTIDLIAHAGEHPEARPDLVLQAVRRTTVATDRSPLEDQDLPLWDDTAAPASLSPLVVGGIPLPRGVLTDPAQVRLFHQDREWPVQTRVTGWWPDRSIKWLLLTFPLEHQGNFDPGEGDGSRVPFDVTFRDGSKRRFVLVHGPAVRSAKPRRAVVARAERDTVTIDTGPLRLTIGPGTQWLREVMLHGQSMLAPDADVPQASIDFLRVGEPYVVNTTHPSGEPDPGPVVMDKVELEEAGALRAVVRLEGRSQGAEPATVIVRLVADLDRPWLRMTHQVVFMQQDPRSAFVRRMAVTLPLRQTTDRASITLAADRGHISAKPGTARALLRQHSHLHGEVLESNDAGWRSTALTRSGGWVDMAGGGRGLAVVLRDMWQSHPNAIVADAAAGAMSVEMWPASAPIMDVRRYSDFAHISQGEATRSGNDPANEHFNWVEDVYYKQEPFVGVSRTHEMLWLFHDASCDARQLAAVAADVQSPPLIYAGADWYRDTGVWWDSPDWARSPLVSANLDNLTDFWLFHQRRWGWYGFWDFGDMRHGYGSGHGWCCDPNDLKALLALPPEQRSEHKDERAILDYTPEQDWAFDNGRCGWSNTEGLPGLFLQSQYLRTGRRDVYFAAEAHARHVRDVDMRHAGRWLGRGTRHGVQHWSDGNHEERQTCFSEFRWMCHLSGDRYSTDFAQLLLRQIHDATPTKLHADHSGRLFGLLGNWEFTGDPRIGRLLHDYTRLFIVDNGIAISPVVQFPGPKRTAIADINDGHMFFHTFGGLHAMIEYADLVDDRDLTAALIRMARFSIESPAWKMWVDEGDVHYLRCFHAVLAFACRHADDPAPYRDAMRRWMDNGGWRFMYHIVATDSRRWTHRHQPLRLNVPVAMMFANWIAYLARVIDTHRT